MYKLGNKVQPLDYLTELNSVHAFECFYAFTALNWMTMTTYKFNSKHALNQKVPPPRIKAGNASPGPVSEEKWWKDVEKRYPRHEYDAALTEIERINSLQKR